MLLATVGRSSEGSEEAGDEEEEEEEEEAEAEAEEPAL